MMEGIRRASVARLRGWLWALRVKPSARTVRRIRAEKEARRLSGRTYDGRPRASVIVQSFNQVRNVDRLERVLRATCADELIVCEDGSTDGSHEQWQRRLSRPNDFLIASNDLHEIRTYDRAIGLARGEFVCLMQDDDRPPRDGRWLEHALALFAEHPRLAVLGGWCGFDDFFDRAHNAPWNPPGKGSIPTCDPATGMPLMFVESVNIGPYLLRRSDYRDLGGFDFEFSGPGEPGITFESEFCYRAWCSGRQVALTDIPVKMTTGEQGYILPGGTTLWGNEERVRNEAANKQRIQERYGDELPEIQGRVRAANTVLVPSSGDPASATSIALDSGRSRLRR